MNATRALIFLPILLLAQDPKEALQEVRIRSGPYSPAKATIAVQTNLVELGVTVRNRQGQPVGGLKASDFELTDSGKSATITFFEEQKARHIETGASTSSVASTVLTSVAVARFIVLFSTRRTQRVCRFRKAGTPRSDLYRAAFKPAIG